MTGEPGAQDAPHTLSDGDRAQGNDPLGDLGELERREMLAWVGENLTEVRRTATRQRPSIGSSGWPSWSAWSHSWVGT
jgi:hypothetical protein